MRFDIFQIVFSSSGLGTELEKSALTSPFSFPSNSIFSATEHS